MTKIDIFSGFLGAGKTTLIKKLLKEAYKGEQVVLIENEFGEIGIDGGFLKEAGVEIREMNSGCICCSLVGDFGTALKEVIAKYEPQRIVIEPSGVGKLSDVIKAVQKIENEVEIKLNSFTTVVDATKCKMYMKNFGEFFSNQIEYAGTVILSRTDKASEEKIATALEIIRGLNQTAAVITTPIEKLSGEKILDTMENNAVDIMTMSTITTMKNVDADMSTSMNIIMTTTMKNVDADMTMSMNIITTTTMKNVDADTTMTMIIIITIMQMKCSQAGGKRQQRNIQKKEFMRFWKHSLTIMTSTEWYCVQKVW